MTISLQGCFSKASMRPKVIFFDAAGTLIQVREPVGKVYARVAAGRGIEVESDLMEAAFRWAWKQMPPPQYDSQARDDGRSWWRGLVGLAFTIGTQQDLLRAELDALFEELYEHYADPLAWTVYPDVRPALDRLSGQYRLFMLSNFDGRLRTVLAGHGLDSYFEGMVISSEVGASKPSEQIFHAALAMAQERPDACLHVGDEMEADIAAAKRVGMAAFHVGRPESGLDQILA